MLYYIYHGPKSDPHESQRVFQVMEVEDRTGLDIRYGIFCYTGNHCILEGGFASVKDMRIGEDAWYIPEYGWVPINVV